MIDGLKNNILKNKTNSQNMSSAKKNEEDEKENNSILDSASKIREWHKGLQSNSGWERLQTGAKIAKTIMMGM